MHALSRNYEDDLLGMHQLQEGSSASVKHAAGWLHLNVSIANLQSGVLTHCGQKTKRQSRHIIKQHDLNTRTSTRMLFLLSCQMIR